MPKIPLYEQQTKVSAETSSPLLDRSAEIQSIQNIANTYAKGVGNLASGINDMIDNYEKLEEQSAVADANREMIDFKLEIAKERDEVLKRDDVNLSNYEEKYLLPKIKEFKEKLNNKGYSPKAMRRLVPVIDTDLGDLRNEEQLTQIKIKQQQHVSTITNEANTLLRTSNRQAGVDILNEAVADGFILQSDANELINEADKDYFTKEAEQIFTHDDLKNIGDADEDRWEAMDQSVKDSILAERSKKIQEEYNKNVGTIFNSVRTQAKALEISEGEINKLNIHPDLVDELLKIRRHAVIKEEKKLRGGEKTGEDFKKLEKDMESLFLGQSNDPKALFKSIMDTIINSDKMSEGLKENYIDEMVDKMKTEAGYNVFVLGQKGVDVYGGGMELKAWQQYWSVYDDATTYMESEDKSQAFLDAKTNFRRFIEINRDAALGVTEKRELKKQKIKGGGQAAVEARLKAEEAKKEQEVFKSRALSDGQPTLEFDSKGFLLETGANKAAITAFINKEFAPYRQAQAEKYYNEAINKVVPMGRKTIFSQYYLAPRAAFVSEEGKVDPLAISRENERELRSLGILDDAAGITGNEPLGQLFYEDE